MFSFPVWNLNRTLNLSKERWYGPRLGSMHWEPAALGQEASAEVDKLDNLRVTMEVLLPSCCTLWYMCDNHCSYSSEIEVASFEMENGWHSNKNGNEWAQRTLTCSKFVVIENSNFSASTYALEEIFLKFCASRNTCGGSIVNKVDGEGNGSWFDLASKIESVCCCVSQLIANRCLCGEVSRTSVGLVLVWVRILVLVTLQV